MSVKTMALEDVMSSKVFVKSGSSVTFGAPRQYFQPFIDKALEVFPEAAFNVKVADPVVNAEETGVRNIAYSRVLVEADLGELIEDFRAVVGMVYALDLQKPVIKVYSGFNVSSCINLTIFNADRLHTQEMLGDFGKAYENANEFLEKKKSEVVTFNETLTKLQTTFLTEVQLNQLIGKMVREAPKLRLGTTPVLQAAKMLDDNTSTYYVRPDGQFTCSKFNLYNAVTQAITNSSDIVDRAIKTIQLSNLILN